VVLVSTAETKQVENKQTNKQTNKQKQKIQMKTKQQEKTMRQHSFLVTDCVW